MPILAAWLLPFFSSAFSLVAAWFGKKVALYAVLSSIFLGLTVAFYAAIKLLLAGVAGQITDPWWLMAFYSCLPDNFATCITAMISADILAFFYRYQVNALKILAST